jgi:4-hydroxy-tetrahydrodipicolinate synthase
VAKLVNLALQGNYLKARELHLEHFQFFSDIFIEPNPVPIKTLLNCKGIIESAEVRLPLTPPSANNLLLLQKMAQNLNI